MGAGFLGLRDLLQVLLLDALGGQLQLHVDQAVAVHAPNGGGRGGGAGASCFAGFGMGFTL